MSPVHVVRKKAGVTVTTNEKGEEIQMRLPTKWRVCIDYRKLNSATKKEHFPLPRKINRRQRSHVLLAPSPSDACHSDCATPPSTSQWCLRGIFSDVLGDSLEVFMDDFSAFGNDFESCLAHVTKIHEVCVRKRLVLGWEKSHFMVREGVVLGHIVSGKGLEVDKAKIELIQNLPLTSTVKDLRSFLGHVGFYRRLIQDFAKVSKPLTTLIFKKKDFLIDEEWKRTFTMLKQALIEAPILQSPNWDLPFEIMCDALDYAVGAVLGQRLDKKPTAICYASKTHIEAQINYTTTEKELW